jgi:DNA replication protein DnaC
MTLSELWTQFRLLQGLEAFSETERSFLERFLREEHRARQRRRTEYLMKMSGIGRPKLFDDFDWAFNPKIPRDKIMEYVKTDFLKKPSSLVLVGAADPDT